MASLGVLFGPGPIDGASPDVVNPMGIEALQSVIFLVFIPILAIPVCMAGSAIALVQRFRRSTGVQRQQLKWLTTAAALVAGVYLVTMAVSIPYDWDGERTPLLVAVLQNTSLYAFVLIPVAVCAAILRYRLYDIDRLINRALVYATASALLALVYAGGVVGTQSLLRVATGSTRNNLAVAVSTLAVAALFRPVRASVQGFVDRRFYRSRYDAVRTVEAFSARLRQETDLAALTEQLRGVITQTVQPAGVSLWIASPPRDRVTPGATVAGARR